MVLWGPWLFPFGGHCRIRTFTFGLCVCSGGRLSRRTPMVLWATTLYACDARLVRPGRVAVAAALAGRATQGDGRLIVRFDFDHNGKLTVVAGVSSGIESVVACRFASVRADFVWAASHQTSRLQHKGSLRSWGAEPVAWMTGAAHRGQAGPFDTLKGRAGGRSAMSAADLIRDDSRLPGGLAYSDCGLTL